MTAIIVDDLISRLRESEVCKRIDERNRFNVAGTVLVPCARSDDNWVEFVGEMKDFLARNCRARWRIALPMAEPVARAEFERAEDAALFRLAFG